MILLLCIKCSRAIMFVARSFNKQNSDSDKHEMLLSPIRGKEGQLSCHSRAFTAAFASRLGGNRTKVVTEDDSRCWMQSKNQI